MQQSVKDKLIQRVTNYYAQYGNGAPEIAHTQSVALYTRLIAFADNRAPLEIDLLEIVGWLHDIGCPASRRLYGNSRPVNQQHEGRLIVNEWLKDENWLSVDEKAWLSDVVASHHQYKSARLLHFEPLFEADLIVNLAEGYYNRSMAHLYYEKLMNTAYGKQLYQQLFFDK